LHGNASSYRFARRRNTHRRKKLNLDPVNLLSLWFGYCSPLVQLDGIRCNVTKPLKTLIICDSSAFSLPAHSPGWANTTAIMDDPRPHR